MGASWLAGRQAVISYIVHNNINYKQKKNKSKLAVSRLVQSSHTISERANTN